MRELSLHILDIVQNSISANSMTIIIEIEENHDRDQLIIKITDDGKGMTAEQLKQATDPFFTTRTSRDLGFGIPLFNETVSMAGGHLTVESELGKGTRVTAKMQWGHINRPPIGDMVETMMCILMSNPIVHILYMHRIDQNSYRFDSAEFDQFVEESGAIKFTVLNQMRTSIQLGLDKIRSKH